MRAPSPRLLLAASAVLAAAFVVAVLLTRPAAPPAPAPTTATPTTSAPTTSAPPPPPAPPLAVTPSAFSAVVRAPDALILRWGPVGSEPLLWTPVVGGEARLAGLLPHTAYAVDDGTHQVTFTTPAVPPSPVARVRLGAVEVDGAPFFPLMTWQECPGAWNREIREGIDLFAGNPCTNLASLAAGVAGRALVAGTADDAAGTTGPGLVGWFYPDEADGHGLDAATLPAPGGPGLRFLTLTAHFFGGAAPLPAGRGMYPGLVAAADVVGFDLYPLQELCRPELLPWVFDAQAALRRLAPRAATFQWIEVREMKCPAVPVTPATIRAESWLAIAGGATGLGFFPADWDSATGTVVQGVALRVRQLLPALVQPPLPVAVTSPSADVRASARTYDGALYVLAVNGGATGATATLASSLLGDRQLTIAGRPGDVSAHGGSLTVDLPPHAVRILVAPPVPSEG